MLLLKKVVRKFRKVKTIVLVFLSFPKLFKNKSVSSDEAHLQAVMEWLCVAQDKSECGGVSALYNLEKKKWDKAYRETTGYIIPTFINYYTLTGQKKFLDRALRMGNWEIDEQLPDGSYGEEPKKEKAGSPLIKKVFNTGQVILGLCFLYDYTHERKFLDTAIKSASWLVSIQEKDGSWQKFTTNGARTYHARVAWSLLEVYKRTKNQIYKVAAENNLAWVLAQQNENKWFKNCSLSDPDKPWTHLIAYTIRGLLESSEILQSKELFQSALEATQKIIAYYDNIENFKFTYLPGTFDANWRSKDAYTCLTGDAQLALIFLKMWHRTKDEKFKNVASKIIDQIKETQVIKGHEKEIVGGIGGSYPIYGEYASFTMLNWAAKFFADCLITKRTEKFDFLP